MRAVSSSFAEESAVCVLAKHVADDREIASMGLDRETTQDVLAMLSLVRGRTRQTPSRAGGCRLFAGAISDWESSPCADYNSKLNVCDR